MRALVWHGNTDLRIEDASEPPLPPGAAVGQVVVAGICGSDLHGYRGHPGPRVPPLVLGHEVVVRLDGAGGLCAVFPLASCGLCEACLRDEEQLCVDRGLLGMDRPGVFAERIAVPARALVPLPAGVDATRGALAEPFAVALSAVRADNVGSGTRMLVIGGGPIGLLTAVAAVDADATVTLVDPLANRRNLAADVGLAVLADATDAPAESFDVVVDTAGYAPTWNAAQRAARRGGRVALVGLGDAHGDLAAADLVRRGVTLRGHFAYSRSEFADAVALLPRLRVPDGWITSFALEEGAEAFRRLVEQPEHCVKALLWPGGP